MKIFLAGATGAIGERLVPLLRSGGHAVTGTTRSPSKAARLRASGTDAVVLDALDREAVIGAVVAAAPDVVVHQVTALATLRSLRKFDREFALTNRLRTEGTEHLLAGARAVGARVFVAQSYTGWPNDPRGARVQTEDDPLDPDPPPAMRATLDAIRRLEAVVTGADGLTGIVLRYGSFYGPGTSISRESDGVRLARARKFPHVKEGAGDGEIVRLVRARKFPIVGDGAGVWSFIHIDDAAEATKLAIDRAVAGIYNITDDEPAEVSRWLPELARAVGAPPPRRIPAWLARLAIGAAGVAMMTRSRGSSNAKAKRVLGWEPRHPTWRAGFQDLR